MLFPNLPLISKQKLRFSMRSMYRVTIQLVQNLQLTSKPKFRFGLARTGQGRPKRNFGFEVTGRF